MEENSPIQMVNTGEELLYLSVLCIWSVTFTTKCDNIQ